MFSGEQDGKARAAIEFYVSLFPQSSIESLDLYGLGENEPDGTVRVTVYGLKGRTFMDMDSAMPHPFTFTPSMSPFVDCDTEEEITRLYSARFEEGEVLIPLDNLGFSRQFGWVNDRFGMSWQLNLAA
jgi:predicted 3-demethylubiquinone-9 3-methyltransferase (glyoxalase superfamily)